MSFAEEFKNGHGEPIRVGGQLVHAVYRLTARAGQQLRLRRDHSIVAPVQGISLSTPRGTLRCAGTAAKDLVVWADTAPPEVLVTCDGKGREEVSVWNCWRDDRGVTQAWIGNAGMVIDELGPGLLRFGCNSRGDVTFRDLIFELSLKP